jgi:GT2 family glycosyltransferase
VGSFNERLVRNQDIEFNYRLHQVGGRVLLVPAIRSRYHCRSSLGGFLQQNFRKGQWNVVLLKEAPGALSARHLVPLLFVLALLASLALSPWSQVGRALLGAIALSYGALGGAFAVNLARRHGWRYLPGLLTTFPSLHVAYGLGYLAGFLRFGVPRALLRPSTLAGLLASRRVS